MGDKRGTYTNLLGRPEGKRTLRRPRRRWEDNIKLGRQEAGWGGMDWIELAEDKNRLRALVHVVMDLRFLKAWRNSSMAADLVASQEGPNCMDLVS
jgi:hypothetical protein